MKVEERVLQDLNKLKVIQRRFEAINVARYRDESKIKRASVAIDKIREKTRGKTDKSMTEVVRRWRDTRYGPSSS